MLVYVDNKKINVDTLESIYIINQTFGDGIIKYKGITLSSDNNFAYYGIQENSHLILHGIKGGDSEAKPIGGLILNIIVGIVLFLTFVFTVGTGLYTTIIEFLFIFVRDLITGQLLNTNLCKDGIRSKVIERFSHKLLRVMMTIIFIVFSIVLIYYSIYIFANLVSLIFLYTSKKILNLTRGEQETDTEILCESLKNASKVGVITASVYTGIYYVLRIPNAIIEFIENKAPFEVQVFNPILNTIDAGLTLLKDTLVLSIPILGEMIDGYLGVIGSAVELIWSVSRMFKDIGDPFNNYIFSCNATNSLDKLYELFKGIVTGTGEGSELQETVTDLRLMTIIKAVLGKSAEDIVTNPKKRKMFKQIYKTNGKDLLVIDKHAKQYETFIKGGWGFRKYIVNTLFVIICQLLQFANVFGIKILEFSPTFEKPLDMISDGLYSGMISVIVFIITLVVLCIKNLF